LVEAGAAIEKRRAGDEFLGAEVVVEALIARFAAQASRPKVWVPATYEGLSQLAIWSVTAIGIG
jgi:hypothetical protein